MTQPTNSRVAVITGASSGIGKAAAKALAQRGWHVIAHGRDPQRSAEAETEIKAVAGTNVKVDFVRGDLTSLADTARMADDIGQLTDHIDVLINNAGGVRKDFIVTPEGNEVTFAGNHLGHFLLTNRLLPLMEKAAAARIINVSSSAHMACQGINWDDPQMIKQWNSGAAYCVAKLCNILFTRELAKRLAGKNIVVNAMHPGVVASNFASHADEGMQKYLATQASTSPEQAADTMIWLATDPEAGRTSGGYFHERKPAPVGPAGQDDNAAARLWAESEALVTNAGVSMASIH